MTRSANTGHFARFLEKRGFLERDAENSYLALEQDDDDAMVQLQGHSITYRIAVGPQQGRKIFTLQTLPPDDDSSGGSDRVARAAGFSLHAGVSTEAHQRDKLWKVLLLRIPACGVREAPGTDYEWQRQL